MKTRNHRYLRASDYGGDTDSWRSHQELRAFPQQIKKLQSDTKKDGVNANHTAYHQKVECSLRSLDPKYVNGLLWVGGRPHHAEIPEDARHFFLYLFFFFFFFSVSKKWKMIMQDPILWEALNMSSWVTWTKLGTATKKLNKLVLRGFNHVNQCLLDESFRKFTIEATNLWLWTLAFRHL